MHRPATLIARRRDSGSESESRTWSRAPQSFVVHVASHISPTLRFFSLPSSRTRVTQKRSLPQKIFDQFHFIRTLGKQRSEKTTEQTIGRPHSESSCHPRLSFSFIAPVLGHKRHKRYPARLDSRQKKKVRQGGWSNFSLIGV